jgi:outer membrane protein assembly factor BamB
MLVHADSTGTDWPMFQHDAAHTGYSTAAGPLDNQTLWVYATNGGTLSCPVISNGIVYVTLGDNVHASGMNNYASGNNIYALDSATGNLVWNYSTKASVEGPAAVSGGIVYVASNESVYALDAKTGNPSWTSNASGVSPVVSNGIVFVVSTNGNFFALNASTGNTIWSVPIQASDLVSTPAVDNGLIYYTVSWRSTITISWPGYTNLDSGVLYALNASNGNVAWHFEMEPATFSPFVNDGIVYVGDGYLHALNASTGASIWNYTTLIDGYPPNIFSSPSIANGIIYLSSNAEFFALNASTGGLIRNYGHALYYFPTVANDTIYACLPPTDIEPPSNLSSILGQPINGKLVRGIFAVNATSGNIIWNYTEKLSFTNFPDWSSLAIANGVLYLTSSDGKVYAFGTARNLPNPSPNPTKSTTASPTPLPSIPEIPNWTVVILPIFAMLTIIIFSRSKEHHRCEKDRI